MNEPNELDFVMLAPVAATELLVEALYEDSADRAKALRIMRAFLKHPPLKAQLLHDKWEVDDTFPWVVLAADKGIVAETGLRLGEIFQFRRKP